MALWGKWRFLGFTRAEYEWSPTALSYGLDRLVPPSIAIDLESLGLSGDPRGRLRVEAAVRTPLAEAMAVSA
jgi:hypothetical protein